LNRYIIYSSDKKPRSPHNGQVCNPHDTQFWVDRQAAENAVANGLGIGVGMVFAEHHGNFFVDIDHCLQPDGSWSPVAVQLCQVFAGAYIEVSSSGTGIHIIGKGVAPVGHSTRNTALGLEVYTTGRYCALAGHGATGSFDHPAQQQLDWLLATYFNAGSGVTVTPGDWSTEACEGYGGPEDDTELLERMTRSTSVQGAFLGKATLGQLLDGETGSYGDDASAADSALCCHLAFWTGKNCERMDRLFRDSGLMRDKWDRGAGQGKTYGQLTIAKAVSLTRSVYSPKQPEPTPPPTGDPSEPLNPAIAALRTGTQLLTSTGLLDHFKGMTYIMNPNAILCPDGSLMDQSRFNSYHGGWEFMMDPGNAKPSKSPWEAFTMNRGCAFPKVHDICFRPECPPGEIITEEGRQLVNTYVPIVTTTRTGDPSRFTDHLARMLPVERDREILIAYLAALVQHPGVKFQWAPLLVGMEGNGKSLIGRCIEHCVGSRYSHTPNANDIDNKFNGWLQGKLLILLEEVYTADRANLIEVLKPLITNSRVEIQGKGQDQRTGDNRANFLLFSNHKDAIRKTGTDRRYAIFFTAQQETGDMERDGMVGSYFPDLYNWLREEGYEIVNEWLRSYPIPVELNPAITVGGQSHRAPETSSTAEALANSLGGIEQEIQEAISEGRPGFCGGWISSLALGRLLDEKRLSSKVPRNKRAEMLRKMGWVPHTAMPGGRVASVIPFDNGKPVLYVERGSLLLGLQEQASVVRRYIDAQTGGSEQGAISPFSLVK
jgi:hypothetical protein